MARKLLVLLYISFLFAIVFAKVPSYIQICGRRNPNLDQCVLDSVTKLLPKLKSGIPELDVPSLEPLIVEEIPLADLKDFRTIARNVKLNGLSNYVIKFLHIDLEKQIIDIDMVFPQVRMRGDYDVNARILVPVTDKGPIDCTADNIIVKAVMKFETPVRKGVRLMYISEMSSHLVVTDYTAHFRPDSKNNPIAQAVNSVLQNSRKEIIESMTPNLEKAINQKILDVANKICKRFTFDELFPDRL